ncbi:MAG: DUF2934 domain-containing protein [Thermoanaerobaculia bacterium]
MAVQTKITAPSERSQEPHSQAAELAASDAVAVRAYELFEQRGREPGRDVDDWLRAEHEVAEMRRPVQA